MGHVSPLRLIFALVALLLACAAGSARADYDDELLARINEYRVSHDLGPLTMRPELTRLALNHSRAMKRAGRLSHDGFKTRFRAAQKSGVTGCVENVGWNYPTPAGQFEGWQGSEGHNRNMLDPKITGAGVARAGTYVTFFACY